MKPYQFLGLATILIMTRLSAALIFLSVFSRDQFRDKAKAVFFEILIYSLFMIIFETMYITNVVEIISLASESDLKLCSIKWHECGRVRVRVRFRVTLRLAVYRQSVRLGAKPFENQDQYFLFQLNTCGYSPYVTSSLTRGWARRLKLLLAIASAVILGFEFRGTHDHILLFQIRDSPNLEGQVPVFISPRKVAQLYP
jgi:hypothetical protein